MKKTRTGKRTMAEVARRAGVSLSTVSRALAGSPLISAKTRRAVEQAAARLDYRVDAAGSSLRTGQTRTVGVVIPLAHAAEQKLSDPFFMMLIGGIADALSARGYSMLLSKAAGNPADWITQTAGARRADGFIVIGQSLHHAALDTLAAEGIPVIVWGAALAGQRYVTVGSENAAGAEAATVHLLAEGCRRIVFLGDPGVPEVAARLAGFRRALRAAGVQRDRQLELAVQFGSETAYQAVRTLIAKNVAFDAVFACSDVFAISAIRALNEAERRVPADVAVTGFDDIPFASLATPPLTTVRQACGEGARLLVAKLLQSIGGEAVDSAVLPTELVVRRSSLAQAYRALPAIDKEKGARAGGKRRRTRRSG